MFFFLRQYRPGKCVLGYSRKKKQFLGFKNKKFKKSRIEIFSRGQSMVFSQNWLFFHFFFFKAIQARKMCFMIFQNKKTVFQALKTRSSKSQKIEIFSKGLVHGFRPKLAIFPCFFFKAIQARKMCFMIFQNKTTLFLAKKQEIKNLEKLTFF